MADDVDAEILRTWSMFERTTRIAKVAEASPSKPRIEALGTVAQPLDAAWDIVHPIFDEQYVLVDPYGVVVDKARLEKAIRSGTGIFENYQRSEHDVRVNGDTGVYVSLVKLSGERGGVDVSGEYRETHVMVKRGTGWVVVASQMTKVNDPGRAHPIMGAHAQAAE